MIWLCRLNVKSDELVLRAGRHGTSSPLLSSFKAWAWWSLLFTLVSAETEPKSAREAFRVSVTSTKLSSISAGWFVGCSRSFDDSQVKMVFKEKGAVHS
jgi:hypothetical protein